MNLEKIGVVLTLKMKTVLMKTSFNKEIIMEMIKEAIEHMWRDHRKMVIGAGVVIVILIIAAL